MVSTTVRSGMPSGTSTTPVFRTAPERLNTLVPALVLESSAVPPLALSIRWPLPPPGSAAVGAPLPAVVRAPALRAGASAGMELGLAVVAS
jgi:hypothetical protein